MTAAIHRIDALFAHNAATIPQRPHLLWQQRRQTYAETYQRAARLASAFLASGIGPGERVLVLTPNGRELVELYIACGLVDAICVPVNTLSTARELFNTARDCEPSAFVVHESLADRVSDEFLALAFRMRLSIGREVADRQDYEATLDAHAPLERPVSNDADSPAVMIYSSGTTGRPKGILLRHAAVVANAQMTQSVARYQIDDRNIALLPLFSSFGSAGIS